jgi:hypothetical protein
MALKCPTCGAVVGTGAQKCQQCGQSMALGALIAAAHPRFATGVTIALVAAIGALYLAWCR